VIGGTLPQLQGSSSFIRQEPVLSRVVTHQHFGSTTPVNNSRSNLTQGHMLVSSEQKNVRQSISGDQNSQVSFHRTNINPKKYDPIFKTTDNFATALNYASSPSTQINYLQAFGTGSQGNSFLIQKEPSVTTIKQEYGGLTNIQGLRKIANPADIEAVLNRTNFSSGMIVTQTTLQQKSNQDRVSAFHEVLKRSLSSNLQKAPTSWHMLHQLKTRKKVAGARTNSIRSPQASSTTNQARLAMPRPTNWATKILCSSSPIGQ